MSSRTPKAADPLARLCKGIAHPARVRIVKHLIATNGATCGALVDACGLAQSTVSQHLEVLARSGLIGRTDDGYRIETAALQQLRILVAGL